MGNYILDILVGTEFLYAVKQSKTISESNNVVVEFNFNDVTCVVCKNTDPKLLELDYINARQNDIIGVKYLRKIKLEKLNKKTS